MENGKSCGIHFKILSTAKERLKQNHNYDLLPLATVETGNSWQFPSPCKLHKNQKGLQPAERSHSFSDKQAMFLSLPHNIEITIRKMSN